MIIDEPLDELFLESDVLTFDNGEIDAIPGFSITRFAGEMVAQTEKQNFSFTSKTNEIIETDVVEDKIFTMSNQNYVITFKVASAPVDFNGLSTFYADFISREVL